MSRDARSSSARWSASPPSRASSLALVLALLARDVAASRAALSDGDVEYRDLAREDTGLWERGRSFRSISPASCSGSRTTSRCAEPSARCGSRGSTTRPSPSPTRRSRSAGTRRRRASTRSSRSANDRGAALARRRSPRRLGLARFVSETQDREALLSSTVANLRLAIALDPANDEAKYNLELALQRGRGHPADRGRRRRRTRRRAEAAPGVRARASRERLLIGGDALDVPHAARSAPRARRRRSRSSRCVGSVAARQRRADDARRRRSRGRAACSSRSSALVAGGCLLGARGGAAGARSGPTTRTVRTDAEAFVVARRLALDARAARASTRPSGSSGRRRRRSELRASMPEVPVGIASLTDRVLPHLFPSADEKVFEATLERSLGDRAPAAALVAS